jgi:hypothetical protein
MANARASNVWDVNATGALTTEKSQILLGVIMTATSTGASLVLAESSGAAVKFRADIATDDTTQLFDISNFPIFFSQGIYVQTLTNCVAQLVITKVAG